MYFNILVVTIILCVVLYMSECVEDVDVVQDSYYARKYLIEKLLTNYTKNIRPRHNQKELVEVRMEPILGLIVDFDEGGGVFSWYGGFHMFWRDDHISWNITEYSYINSITLPITQVWVPKPIFSNSAKRRTFFNFDNDFDHERTFVKYYHNGTAYLQTGGIIETSCDADIKYYPADDHVCEIELYSDILDLKFTYPDHDLRQTSLQYFEGDSEWDVTNVSATIFMEGIYETIDFKIHIRRKPMFLITSLVLPLFLVSILNIFTFVLPTESGERTSFAITLFLTFAVVMTVVSETFPATDKLGAFTIFLLMRILTSALTTIVAIISIALYFKDDETNTINSNNDRKISTLSPDANTRRSPNIKDSGKIRFDTRSWKVISYTVDKIAATCLVVEIVIECIGMAIFFALR